MYWLEIQDIMLLIMNLKDTSDANDLHKYIKFANNRTRANGRQWAQIKHTWQNTSVNTLVIILTQTICIIFFVRVLNAKLFLFGPDFQYTRAPF